MLYRKPKPGKKIIEKHRPHKTGEALARAFKICVWNMHKCKQKQCRDEFAALAAQSDIFLAQEIRLYPKLELLLENTPLHWTVAVSFLSLRRGLPTGIATGVSIKPTRTETRADAREPLFGMPKMTMATLINIEDKELLVINVHAINFKGIKAFEANLKTAADLLAAFEGPIIIAGDFNTWSRRRLLAIKTLIFKLKMKEVKFKPDDRTRFFKKPVDYIFYRGLKLKSASALKVQTSDHNPLLAGFELL